MLRIYTRLLALVLALFGIAALASIIRVAPTMSIVYLSSAAISAYVGLSHSDPDTVRTVIGGMGVVFLLLGLFRALIMSVLGFPYEGEGWEMGLINATLGALTMACAVLLPCADE